MCAKLTAHAVMEFTAFTVNGAVLRRGKHRITSWSPQQCVRFTLKHTAQTDLMMGLSRIVLSFFVQLTDTVPKHIGPKHYFKDLLCQNKKFKYILKTTLFAQKAYRFISSCDHDNIKTILLLRYHDIDNIVTSLYTAVCFLFAQLLATLPFMPLGGVKVSINHDLNESFKSFTQRIHLSEWVIESFICLIHSVAPLHHPLIICAALSIIFKKSFKVTDNIVFKTYVTQYEFVIHCKNQYFTHSLAEY